MRIILEGKSQKGKNRIREHGREWQIVQTNTNVACLNNKKGFMIRSPGGHVRWIAAENDVDFIIKEQK